MNYTIECANKLEYEQYLFRIALKNESGFTTIKVLYFVTFKGRDYIKTFDNKGWQFDDLKILHEIISTEKHTFPTLIRRCIRSINKFKKETSIFKN